jgi:DNA repair exonuclease SbcCD ATPase subunit
MAVMLPDKWSQLKLPSIGKADPAEQERLLKLFWNRAELKKELQSLDDQLHNLRNKLKQQENANTRLQQQLEQLEVLLGSPERGLDALVHFGLKALWRACREQLEKFAAELKRERQDAQRKLQLAEFQQHRAERLKVADQRLCQAQEVTDAERARMADCERRLGQLQRFWHYFKRRTLAAEILAQRARCVAAEHHLGEMREAHRTIEKEPWPEFPGLTIDGRRLVNLAVIAYAQHLFARLAVSGLAMDARLANNRSVESAKHGNLEACLSRLREVAQALALVNAQDGLAAEIRKRGEKLAATATWRNANETVPQPASLPPAATGGVPDANVLVDDYWDVYKVLLR